MPATASTPPHPTYADWTAPKADRQWLLWPASSTPDRQLVGTGGTDLRQSTAALLPLLALNKSLLAFTTPSLDLPALRHWSRAQFGLSGPSPVIATGHQVELHHAGVWIKSVVMDQLARSAGGRALYLAVDTDSPKHLAIQAPASRAAQVKLSIPLTDEAPPTDLPFAAAVPAPSPAHIAHLTKLAAGLSSEYGYPLPLADFFARFNAITLDQSGAVGPGDLSLTRMMADATHAIDTALGLDYAVLLASTVWDTPAFAYWLARMLADPQSAAATYNAAIEAYRRDNQIAAPGQPMPPLAISPDQIELPFWLDNTLTTERVRLTVKRIATANPAGHDAGWQIHVPWPLRQPLPVITSADFSADPFAAATGLSRALIASGLRPSARALTLTLFMRLSVADLFIHGLGGGRYDQVADRWISAWLGITPPAFAVATATQRLPFAQAEAGPSVRETQAAARKLSHTLPAGGKQQYLTRIAALPRRSAARKAEYLAMQRRLTDYRHADPDGLLKSAQLQIETARSRAERSAILLDRELHYCLMPWEVLSDWVGQPLTPSPQTP
jgi:hypothetical protein